MRLKTKSRLDYTTIKEISWLSQFKVRSSKLSNLVENHIVLLIIKVRYGSWYISKVMGLHYQGAMLCINELIIQDMYSITEFQKRI